MSNWPTNGNLTGKLSVGQGEPGKSLEYMWRGTELGIRQEGEEEYQFVNLAGGGAGSSGTDGREIELQVNNGYIQWRYVGEEEWNKLIALSVLEGKQGPQGIQGERGPQGERGEKGEDGITPNITIGTVTTLEAGEQATVVNSGTKENPIFDFGIPKGANGTGGGNASIDDNTISTEKTWSSSKTEDFVLNNVGAIWQEINGGQMTIDSTMDGFLREVEILGNTTQNQEDLSDIQHLGIWNEEKQGYEIEIVVSNSSSKDDLNYQEFRTTIVLPCQLMKVGDISDRLYWDSNKGRYVIEKKIDNYVISQYSKFRQWNKTYCLDGTGIPNAMMDNDISCISDKLKGNSVTLMYGNGMEGIAVSSVVTISNGTQNDPDGVKQWVDSLLPITVTYILKTPQLIETNITKEILLPSYKNKTHLFVTGGIDGSIKAKVPIDGGKAIQSLSAKNTALAIENEEIKAINKEQDELINTIMLVTDEMYSLLEPLLANVLVNGEVVTPLLNMYVAMVKRDLKTIDQVPEKYREQIKAIINESH